MADDHRPPRGYSWAPFEPGHEVSVQHGAHSPAKVDPLAAEIERQARTSPAWPVYLDDPAYSNAVTAWARSEAVAELLWRHVAGRDVEDVLADISTSEEEETGGKGQPTRRVSTARRTRSTLEWWQRADRTAAGHRQRLGLDPLSRARLGKDVAVTAVQAGLAQMQQDGAALVAKARESGALAEAPTEEKR